MINLYSQVGYYHTNRIRYSGSFNYCGMGNFRSTLRERSEATIRFEFIGFRCILLGRAVYD